MSTDKTEQALRRVADWLLTLREKMGTPYITSEAFAKDSFDAADVIDAILTAAPPAQQQSEPTRSQKLADAGFTRRDKRLECDECGEKFSAQLLPAHKCAATPPSLQEPQEAWRNVGGNRLAPKQEQR